MFVYQDGKLYALDKKNKLVGVAIYFDKVLKIKGTESELNIIHDILTASEVKKKFNITEDNPYIFPKVVKKEVVNNESTTNVKRTTKKSTGK